MVLACRVASLLSYKSKSELKQASDGRESEDDSHSIPSKKGGYNIHNRLVEWCASDLGISNVGYRNAMTRSPAGLIVQLGSQRVRSCLENIEMRE